MNFTPIEEIKNRCRGMAIVPKDHPGIDPILEAASKLGLMVIDADADTYLVAFIDPALERDFHQWCITSFQGKPFRGDQMLDTYVVHVGQRERYQSQIRSHVFGTQIPAHEFPRRLEHAERQLFIDQNTQYWVEILQVETETSWLIFENRGDRNNRYYAVLGSAMNTGPAQFANPDVVFPMVDEVFVPIIQRLRKTMTKEYLAHTQFTVRVIEANKYRPLPRRYKTVRSHLIDLEGFPPEGQAV